LPCIPNQGIRITSIDLVYDILSKYNGGVWCGPEDATVDLIRVHETQTRSDTGTGRNKNDFSEKFRSIKQTVKGITADL